MQGHSLQRALGAGQVDRAPITEDRYNQYCDPVQRLLDVEGRAEDSTDLGQETRTPFDPLRFRARRLLGSQSLRALFLTLSLGNVQPEDDGALERAVEPVPMRCVPQNPRQSQKYLPSMALFPKFHPPA